MFLGLDIFFHGTILSFIYIYNTLLILPKDNTKRTIAFNLSLIFFSEKRQIYLIFFFFFFGKTTSPHIKPKWSLPDLCVVQFRPCCQV